MQTLRNRLIILLAVGVLATIGAFMNSPSSRLQGASGPSVTIDPTQLPLPVQGTVASTQQGAWNVGINGTPSVSVNNSPTVNAIQSGAWNVGLTGTPNVKIGNGFSSPVPVISDSPSQIVSAVASFALTSTACTGTNNSELVFSTHPSAGQVFVLTGFTWLLDTAGYPQDFPIGVLLYNASDTFRASDVAFSVTPAGPNGATGKTEAIYPGAVALRPSAGINHLCMAPTTSGTKPTGFAFVHGYFAPDE